MKYLTSSGIENFLTAEEGDVTTQAVLGNFVDTLKDRIDKVRAFDAEVKEFTKKEKIKKKRKVTADSDLTEFLK